MNYIGSKLSLIDFLQDSINSFTNYENEDKLVFADLFAGTGIVGAHYKSLGFEVISNDIQFYSYVLIKHLIENNLASIDLTLFDYFNSLDGVEGFVYLNYCLGSGSGRNYFTDENGKKCDAIRIELEKMYLSKEISSNTYHFYLASLINSVDKFANTASVYGAFLKHIKKSASKLFILEPITIVEGPSGKVYNQNVNKLIHKIKGDILYLDPPYNERQYASNYHVLETIARYDNPKVKGITGMRDYVDQKSEFCSRKTVEFAFENIIKYADFKYIFLSYNNEGLMSLETIKTIMSKYGNYDFYTKDYKRFKADNVNNRKINATSTLEYIHCLEKG